MKFFRSYNFDKIGLDSSGKELVCEDNEKYYTDSESKYSINTLEDNNFYICSVKKGFNILSTACLYVMKDGVLYLHKESFWKETNNDDLDLKNYERYTPTNIPKELVCFKKIVIKDFIDISGKYFDENSRKVY